MLKKYVVETLENGVWDNIVADYIIASDEFEAQVFYSSYIVENVDDEDEQEYLLNLPFRITEKLDLYNVHYMNGESRNGSYAVEYMICDLGNGDELYAEVLEGDIEGEKETELYNMIVEQARAKGIKEEQLIFC